jgi:hypothetical protein
MKKIFVIMVYFGWIFFCVSCLKIFLDYQGEIIFSVNPLIIATIATLGLIPFSILNLIKISE